MFIRVTKSPEELPEDFALNDREVECVRFMDERYRDTVGLLREVCYELAQYQTRAELLEKRLAKYEAVDDFEPKKYVHVNVEC